jgi:hypothetical protein
MDKIQGVGEMKYQISTPKIWKRKFAWYPKRIGAVRIWLERYEVRGVPPAEAQERYPIFPSPYVVTWMEEYRHADQSYWRITRCPLTPFGGSYQDWVSVKPILRVVGLDSKTKSPPYVATS